MVLSRLAHGPCREEPSWTDWEALAWTLPPCGPRSRRGAGASGQSTHSCSDADPGPAPLRSKQGQSSHPATDGK